MIINLFSETNQRTELMAFCALRIARTSGRRYLS